MHSGSCSLSAGHGGKGPREWRIAWRETLSAMGVPPPPEARRRAGTALPEARESQFVVA